jgi:hypothetical protein
MFRVVHPGSGSLLFTHPGSSGQKGTGFRIRIRNTGYSLLSRHLFHILKLSFDHFEKVAGRALPGSLYLL